MSICSRCGASFQCGQRDAQACGACWCMALPPALPVPATGYAATADGAGPVTAGCWCPSCLQAHIATLQRQAPPPAA